MRYRAGIFIVLFLTTLIQGCGRPPFHIVRPGESLYSISWRYDQDYHDLARWNGLKPPYTLTPGQSIILSPAGNGHLGAMSRLEPRTVTPSRSPSGAGTRASSPDNAVAARPSAPAARTPVTMTNSRPNWRWPVRGRLVHGFNARSKGIEGRGLDIAGQGGTPVHAAAAGQVVYSGSGIPSYGNLLIIKHNEQYLSAYAYNRRLLVHEGDIVHDGQVIAEMGASGTASTQAMLHFEIRLNGKPVDPRRLLP